MNPLDDRLRQLARELPTPSSAREPDVWRRVARRRRRRATALAMIAVGGLIGGAALRPGRAEPTHPPAAANPTSPVTATPSSAPSSSLATTTSEPPTTLAPGSPIANDDSVTGVAGESIEIPVLANDTAPQQRELSIAVITKPAHGVVSIAQGTQTIVYAAPAIVTENDSFRYQIVDDAGLRAWATVFVSFASRSPITTADRYSIDQGQSVLLDVTANDSDPDGGLLVLANGFAGISPMGAATVMLENNQARFTPGACVTGPVTFTYWVSDGTGPASGATGTVTVDIAPTPNLPTSARDGSCG